MWRTWALAQHTQRPSTACGGPLIRVRGRWLAANRPTRHARRVEGSGGQRPKGWARNHAQLGLVYLWFLRL